MGRSSKDDIRHIDASILELLNRRASLASIGTNASPADLSLEDADIKRISEANMGPLTETQVITLFREIMSQGRELNAPSTVSYLGPEASFTHQAAFRRFGSGAVLHPCQSISSVFKDVEAGRSSFGVVPVENSTEGAVTYTLDLLVNSDVQICAEMNLRINHCLMSSCSEEDITVVYSHPQVFGQCREWISERLPEAELIEVKSTAEAARRAVEEGHSAIASRMASALYGLPILHDGIEDNPNNSTRFLVLNLASSPPTGDDKTSICFALKDRTGALYDALQPFKEMDINLTMIQSRPSKVRNWDYVFFTDMQGHSDDRPIASALSQLGDVCVFLRVLGSYPRNESSQ